MNITDTDLTKFFQRATKASPHNLSINHLAVLMYLHKKGSGSPTQMSSSIPYLSKNQITFAVRRLANEDDKALIRLKPSKRGDDKRVRTYVLTRYGKMIFRGLQAAE